MAALCGLVVIAALLTGSASASGPREWLMSGSMTGTYSNAVTWINCEVTGDTGTASERVSLHATLGGGKPAPYEPGSGFAPFAHWSGGGSWSVTGSFPPPGQRPDGTGTCGAQRAFHCSGALRRNGSIATTQFAPRGKDLLGHFLQNASFTEGNEPCASLGGALSGAGPLFGLEGTEIERDALYENPLQRGGLTLPRAELAGYRAFSIRHTVGPDGGCARKSEYPHCSQSGKLTLVLHFTPAS
jgi:hypothetical protein